MKCPICKGCGELNEWGEQYDECNACKGTGKVSVFWMFEYWLMNTRLAEWYYDTKLADWFYQRWLRKGKTK